MRLWLLDEVKDVEADLKGLIRVMVERADKEVDILMPGYTHLQVYHTFFFGKGSACRSHPLCSGASPSDGHIFSYHMLFHSATI
jgi:hypothetical protein